MHRPVPGMLPQWWMAAAMILSGLDSGSAFGQPDRLTDAPPLEVRSVMAKGKPVTPDKDGAFNLPPNVGTLEFLVAPKASSSNAPLRFEWQLDGLDSRWREETLKGMRMVVRFQSETKEMLTEESFFVEGQTPGWTGRLEDSQFVYRKERMTVPAYARSLRLLISSAGPPEAVGVYAVRNLVVSQPGITTNIIPLIPRVTNDLTELPLDLRPPPPGWIRGGLDRSDAWVFPHDQDGGITLAIADRHVQGHADWATPRSEGVVIVPGAPLVLEWEETYSIGRGNYQTATYRNVPPGLYRFRMRGLTVMGLPTVAEASVSLIVPVAWWTMPWFYGTVCLSFVGFAFAGWRLTERRKIIRKVKALERDRAVEQERMRIAQDIHDDLGARVTQISLLSSAAQQRPDVSQRARRDFEQVSELSASIVTALYETVWAVSPENDYLDELGAYICQMTTQICAQANVKCRLAVPDFPHDTPLGSKFRHEIIMAVKEAVHNVIRHSGATELQVHILFEKRMLTIIVRDNGKGFDPAAESEGHGLANMERRIRSCGGTCSLQSRAGGGTEVRLELFLSENEGARCHVDG